MMTVCFNNEIVTTEKNVNLNQFLEKRGYTELYFAVAINQHFIPRTNYVSTMLQENDIIDMIMPMQGG